MIGNELEQSIIAVFQDNPSYTFSINQLAKKLKKAYPYINKKTNFFLKEGVLKKISLGKAHRCFLNINNEKTRIFMAMNELNKKDHFLQKSPSFYPVYEKLNKLINSDVFKDEKYDVQSNIQPNIKYDDKNTNKNIQIKIKTILHFNNEIIFVVDNLNKKDTLNKFLSSLKNQTFVFFTAESFQNYFLNNVDFQKNHVVLGSTENYLNIISKINEKLLFKGLIGDSLNENKILSKRISEQ